MTDNDRKEGKRMKKLLIGTVLLVWLIGHAWAEEHGAVEVEVLAKTTTSWDGADLPDYRSGEAEVTILRIGISPGTRLPLHKHPVINAGVLLKGKLTVVTESGKTLHLEAGDAIVEVVDTWHYGRNDGDEKAEIIVFYAGNRDAPVTIQGLVED